MSEAPGRKRRKLSAILMADVSGFSSMMEAREESTIALIQDFHRRTKELVERYEGRVVDTAGDSVFAEFDSVVNAVSCAREIQQDLAASNALKKPEDRIDTRIGLHLGDVVIQDYNVYGDGVNIAARLEALADPGGICFSEAVYQQIQKKLDLPIEDVGLVELKNIQYPVHVYRVPPVTGSARPSRLPELRKPSPSLPVKRPEGYWLDTLRRPSVIITGSIGLLLLLSPLILFPTGGVLPAAGSGLLGGAIGRAWMHAEGRRVLRFLPLGAGIAAGALFTNWSAVTNFAFVAAGVIVTAVGLSRRPPARQRKD